MQDSSSVLQKFTDLVQRLEKVYEPREAQNIIKILFEDLFRIKLPRDQADIFPKSLHQDLESAMVRLLKKEPVQYICKKAFFYGIPFYVDSAVLIPRPETEELVYEAIKILQKQRVQQGVLKVIDIGTGSGCIPIILKKEIPSLKVEAVDISQAALDIAQRNANEIKTPVAFKSMDFRNQAEWEQLGQYNMILSNPPYIPRSEAHLVPDNVQLYEPDIALFVSNEDPLVYYRLLHQFAKRHLLTNGWILLEINQYAAAEVLQLFKNDPGFQKAEILKDLNGNERILKAQKG